MRLNDRYRVVRTIASGGMGTVVLAEDERLGRQVAIKRLHTEGSDEALQRFRREARIGARLSHPNLVTIYDAVVDGPEVMIVMEYVPGRSLAELLRDGPIDRARAASLVRDLGAGLDHAHEQGVLHRDVKPGNILLDPTGRAKLADMGISTAAESTQITITGSVLGTAAYLAPERLDGRPASPASDVYALAAVAYETLVGQRARPGRTPAEIIVRASSEPPPDAREHDPTIPGAAAEAIRRGMAADPAARPATAGQLAEEIAGALEAEAESPAATEPLPPPPPRSAAPAPATTRRGRSPGRSGRRRWAAPIALLAGVAAAVLVVVLLDGDERGDRRAASPTRTPEATATATADQTAEPTPTKTAPPGGGSAPAAAVRAFYENAAADRFDEAWALAAPDLRAAWGGSQQRFAADLGSLESITFDRLSVVSGDDRRATLAIRTRAKHPGYTDNCNGTIAATRGDGGWLVGRPEISCRRSG